MTSERTLIAAVVVLAFGLALIFGYCHGTVGFNAAYPFAGTSLQLAITTAGLPAMAGVGGTVLGVILLLAAFVQAVVREVLSHNVAKRDRLPV